MKDKEKVTHAIAERLGRKNLKEYIEEKGLVTAEYTIENKETVRQCAKKFGISKSIVHTYVMFWNDSWE